MSLSATQDKSDRLSVAFSTYVDLGAESTTGSSKRFTVLASARPCSALMGTDDSAIYKVLGPVKLTCKVSLSKEFIEDALPDAFGRPATEAAVNRRPFAKPFRNVPPGGARSQDPEDPTHDRTMIEVRPTTSDCRR